MKLARTFILAMLLALPLGTGCSYVKGTVHGDQDATGEAWYIRHDYFLFIKTKMRVYYCPPEGTLCIQARWEE